MDHWTCPYCGMTQTVTDRKLSRGTLTFDIVDPRDGPFGITVEAVGCSNSDCKKVTISAFVDAITVDGLFPRRRAISEHRLQPQSYARSLPDFIPAPLRRDYEEACLIADLSPKASATLSRRCLQGMIRDFCCISKRTLFAEITELKKQLDDGTAPRGISDESIEAISAIRTLGNIGAHMEKDISVIVDVDPEEAKVLLELVEMLFDEWYIARDNRAERLRKVTAIAEAKEAAKRLPLPDAE